VRREKRADVEGILRVEDNILGFAPYKEPIGFLFFQIFLLQIL
jgi:hypothetical protein